MLIFLITLLIVLALSDWLITFLVVRAYGRAAEMNSSIRWLMGKFGITAGAGMGILVPTLAISLLWGGVLPPYAPGLCRFVLGVVVVMRLFMLVAQLAVHGQLLRSSVQWS